LNNLHSFVYFPLIEKKLDHAGACDSHAMRVDGCPSRAEMTIVIASKGFLSWSHTEGFALTESHFCCMTPVLGGYPLTGTTNT
jgi:hypothetical protein